MSSELARQVKRELQSHGVTVHEAPGCYSRGNGQQFATDRNDRWDIGTSLHHTATPFGFCPAVLINGRKDLAGPLCNTAGNVDGSVTIVAAFPANHAGASGGRRMGPLPTTRSFNRRMWGHEIVYPGTQPMTAAQYRTALVLSGVISGICGRRDAEWVRLHAETSITGKWDPGYAPGKTISGDKVRADIWPALHSRAPRVVTPAASSSAPPPPPPGRLTRMRSMNLANPDGSTPDLSGVLTVDPVGDSLVMPRGARAWLQWHAFYPGADMVRVQTPECWWLAFCDAAGNQMRALNPFKLPFRASGAVELPAKCASIEIAVRSIPRGGAIGWHIDGTGHAP